MWVMIIGAPGTAKHKIAELLTKDGYEYQKWITDVKGDQSNLFMREATYFAERLKKQFKIARAKREQDIVTVRGTWDSIEVFGSVLTSRGEIGETQFDSLRFIYESLMDTMIPPDVIIYMKVKERMASYNRMALRDGRISEDYFSQLISAYDKYVQRLAVPVIDVDNDHVLDKVWDQVEFGLQSIKTSGLSGDTIWKRGMFK